MIKKATKCEKINSMICRIKEISYEEFSFYIFFSLLTCYQFIPNIALKKYLFVLSIPFLAYKICMTKYSKKEYLVICLLSFFTLIATYTSERQGLLLLLLTFIGIKNVKLKNVVKIFFYLGTVIFSCIVLYNIILYFLSPPTENTMRYVFNIPIYVMKYDLGYGHANMAFALYSTLAFAYIYLRNGNLKGINYCTIFILGIIMFYFTFSRTGFLILVFSLLLMLVRNNQMVVKVLKVFPMMVVAFSFILPFIYANYLTPILESINKLLSNRIFLSKEFMTYFKPNLFGQFVDDITGYDGWYLKCDNSFVLTLCTYGIIIFAFLLIVTFLIYKLKIENIELCLICIFYLYGFMESLFLNVTFNFSLLFLSTYLFNNSALDFSIIDLGKKVIKNVK